MHTLEEFLVQVSDHPAVAMLDQLGGDRFVTMTGAKDFVTSDNPQPRLQMRLPANLTRQRGTHLEVSLTPTDEYTLVYFKGKRGKPGERSIIGVNRNVQVANLRQSFEDLTGLRTSL
jgi:hypothetical protein